jgi:DNA polymerase-3 subunit delta'
LQFKDITGQAELKSKLIQTVKGGRISHTQLFLGGEGTGALPLAIAYSQYINCPNATDTDSCGTCTSCIKYSKYIHPDLHFTFPTITVEKSKKKLSNDFIVEWRAALERDPYMSELQWLLHLDKEGKKQGNITADECRDILRKLSLTSYEAKYKTVIIWLPEHLRNEGNILLKLLEEPPERTLIILVAKDSEKVIPTILSRTQLVRVPALKDEDIERVLVERMHMSGEEAGIVARVAEGNLSLALTLAGEGRADYFRLFQSWMRFCYNPRKGFVDLNAWVDDCVRTGKEFMKSFLNYSLYMVRSAMIFNYGTEAMLRLSGEEREFIRKFAVAIKSNNLPDIYRALNESSHHIERNADPRITFLNLSLYIGTRLKQAA